MVVDAQSRGGVALRIQVDHQHAGTMQCQRGGKVDRCSGLADPALLVGNHHDAGLLRSRQALACAAKGFYRQLGSTTDRGVVHRRRCFT